MRICLISREYPPDTGWGGVGAYTWQISHALAKRGHSVDVVALTSEESVSDQTKSDKNLRVHRVAWKPLLVDLEQIKKTAPIAFYVISTTVALWRKFLELHQIQPFDVIETPEHLAAGVFQAVTSSVPMVIKLHTPHAKLVSERFHNLLPSFENQIICMLERLAILSANVLCSPSEDIARFVVSDVGLDPKQIVIVKNPVDINQFSPDGPRAIAASDNLSVLFVGRLEERKGVQCLVDAIPTVCKSIANVQFIFLGADTATLPGQKSMKEHLKAKLQAAGCEQQVQFISHVPLDKMPNYYRSADLCVVPSLYDNAPYTCIEAMSCAKALIVTASGGASEYIENGKSGLVVPARSSAALAEAIINLLIDANKRRIFGENARRFVEQNLSTDVIAQQMENLYAKAQDNYYTRNAASLYMKDPNLALKDSLDLLCSYEQMLRDALYRQSFDDRLRRRLRLLINNPGLWISSLALVFCKAGLKLIGRQNNPPAFVQKLAHSVEQKHSDRYALTMALADQDLLRAAMNKSRQDADVETIVGAVVRG